MSQFISSDIDGRRYVRLPIDLSDARCCFAAATGEAAAQNHMRPRTSTAMVNSQHFYYRSFRFQSLKFSEQVPIEISCSRFLFLGDNRMI